MRAAVADVNTNIGVRGKHRQEIRVFMLVFLGFLLTSAAYLSWLYHLLNLTDSVTADALTMVAGYCCQAAGIALTAFLFRRRRQGMPGTAFLAVLLLHALCMIPALLGTQLAGTVVFGLLMNLFCGGIAAWYLQELARVTSGGHTALVFGTGYCTASVASYLISLTGGGSALKSAWVIPFYLALTLLLALVVRPFRAGVSSETGSAAADAGKVTPTDAMTGRLSAGIPLTEDAAFRDLLLLACAAVFLLSLTKNLGFSFPSEDILGGLSLELSRIFYAAGLMIAGLISDWNRRYGAFCAFASLIIPFIMLALRGEPVSGMIFWCLDYFIFAFLSVYRVALFTDLAGVRGLFPIAGFGLLFGRLGDAAGTGIHMLLPESTVLLVIVSAAAFLLAAVCFFRLYLKLYMPASPTRSEEEIFEQFAKSHDLTSRERTILRMILAEMTNAQIADKLFLSESTVKYHIHNILQKTDCRNRVDLMGHYTESRRG